MNILLINPHDEFLRTMKTRFEQEGFSVSTGHVGIDAIRMVQEDPPDALILEKEMPGLTVRETLKKIRALDEKLPVFLLTAGVYEDVPEEIRKLGIAGLIPKDLTSGQAGGVDTLANVQLAGISERCKMIREAVMKREQEEISNTSNEEKSETQKKRLLIVEDESHTLETLTDRLEFAGYEIITAEDGEAGLSKAREEKPDLIILDVMLPKMDGFKVCRLLKFDQKLQHIPIIMLTARSQETDVNLGTKTGSDAYMTKPFDFDVLLEMIKRLLP